MIKNIQKLFNVSAALVIGSLILWSCESDADQLGSQFFQNGAQGTETSYPIIAFNVNNNDTIRTDAARLQTATLGAFAEPQFGSQKSSYVSQVRLSTYNPDFGANPVLDSAVLVITPMFPQDSVTTTTNEDYIFPQGEIPSKKVVNTYPVAKYGKTKIGGRTKFNIDVEEVVDFLGANTAEVFSNKSVQTTTFLGTKEFDGNIRSIKVTKDADNSVIFEREAAFRMNLDKDFFQTKIVNHAASPDLADAASFIRYFKGIRVSVQENDGYLFYFDPNKVTINLYYSKDKDVDGTITRENAVYLMNLGGLNTHFNQIAINRSGTPSEAAIAVQDTIVGSPKIFMQGMGGPGMGLKIPAETIATIKQMYQNDKIGIISAKMRIYTDANSWTNSFQKPSYFTVKEKGLNTFLKDMSTLALSGNYSLVKAFDLDKTPSYYDIGITQTLKEIIEKEAQSRQFIINVGSYTTDASGAVVGVNYPTYSQNFNTRSYTPNRVVLVGTDPNNERSAKLILTYGKKL